MSGRSYEVTTRNSFYLSLSSGWPGIDEELRQHMANTIARHDRRGWRLDKPSLAQPNDSIIALCMALDALDNQPEPVQVLGWL